ncbi:MAG: cell division protein FtsQ/DivIB [Bacteroidales bacterium]|nr:cell division protein FtsQ/DivIB [Bacteroidales bacterium]
MTKQGVIRCVLSLLLTAYLVVALCYASQQAAADPYRALKIYVEGNSAGGFVTPDDIRHELGSLSRDITRLPADSINTLAIEKRILAMDNIETANCVVLNNRTLALTVEPLVPAARIFDTSTGSNFYINRSGKRMKANARYRLDAPVVVGRFSDKVQPTDALPVIDYINSRQDLTDLVSSIKVTPKGDILLIPRIRGHVINFGDSSDIANKFDRLLAFYRQVMPVKGWEYYDTLSVKWRGQVVAKQRNKALEPQPDLVGDEEYIDDPGTMMATTDSPLTDMQ